MICEIVGSRPSPCLGILEWMWDVEVVMEEENGKGVLGGLIRMEVIWS